MTREQETRLMASFQDEMEDVIDYLNLSEGIEEDDDFVSRLLCMIAKDEFTHAKYIKHILTEHGVEIPDSYWLLWHKVMARMEVLH